MPVVYVIVRGGERSAAKQATLVHKIGPLCLSLDTVLGDVATATAAWRGLKVRIKVTIANKQAAIEVDPTAAQLIIKAMGAGGDVSFNAIIAIALTMRPGSQSRARELSGTIKEILGTAQSVTGCSIDGRPPHDVIDDIEAGVIKCPDADDE